MEPRDPFNRAGDVYRTVRIRVNRGGPVQAALALLLTVLALLLLLPLVILLIAIVLVLVFVSWIRRKLFGPRGPGSPPRSAGRQNVRVIERSE